MVFINALSCPNEWDFSFVIFQISFSHIIGHTLRRFKLPNVYVNQQANIGPKLLCLIHSLKKLYSCLHKYFFTFLFSICNYHIAPFSYYGFHTIINYIKTFED